MKDDCTCPVYGVGWSTGMMILFRVHIMHVNSSFELSLASRSAIDRGALVCLACHTC